MHKRVFLLWVAALAFMGGSALAQDEGDGDRVPVYTQPTYITVNPDEPLALYVRSVDKNVASVAVMVQTTDGWVQMTPCDNVDVPCMGIETKAEGVEEGEVFYLGSE